MQFTNQMDKSLLSKKRPVDEISDSDECSKKQKSEIFNVLDLITEDSWTRILKEDRTNQYIRNLSKYLETEWKTKQIFPPKDRIFASINLLPFEKVKVVIIGQDPYIFKVFVISRYGNSCRTKQMVWHFR